MISIFNHNKNLHKIQVNKPKLNRNNDWISSEPVLLKIPIEGNIYCDDQVVVNAEGQLKGNIYSKSCVVSGNINGNINCSDFIELKNQAVICGDIKTGAIKIEEGSVVNGYISINRELKLPAFPVDWKEHAKDTQDEVYQRSDVPNPKFPLNSNAAQQFVDETLFASLIDDQRTEKYSESTKPSGITEPEPVENNGSWW